MSIEMVRYCVYIKCGELATEVSGKKKSIAHWPKYNCGYCTSRQRTQNTYSSIL